MTYELFFLINQSDKRNLIKEKIIPRIEAIINNNDLDSMLVYFIMMVKDASISYIYDQDYESYLKDILAEDY